MNEGLAEVATAVAGYETLSPSAFLRSPGGSLVNWPLDGPNAVHYGAGNLFFEYLTGRYGTVEDIALLLTEPADGIQGVDAYLAKLGYDVTFRDVFGDWTVATTWTLPPDPTATRTGRWASAPPGGWTSPGHGRLPSPSTRPSTRPLT